MYVSRLNELELLKVSSERTGFDNAAIKAFIISSWSKKYTEKGNYLENEYQDMPTNIGSTCDYKTAR